MTINQAIEKVNKLKDNAFDDEIIKGFLEDCDRRVYREIIETHEDNKFDYDTRYPLKGDAQLLAEDGYNDFYTFYAIYQIDVFTGEIERYTNNMILFNTKFDEFSSFYNRRHKPLGKQFITTY